MDDRRFDSLVKSLAGGASRRAVLKGLLGDHLRVDERTLASSVFPDSADVKPVRDLVRT